MFYVFLCGKENFGKMGGRSFTSAQSVAAACVAIAVAASAVSGCIGIIEISEEGKEDTEGIWTGPGVNISESDRSVCYATGFDYPEGYDWKTGGETGSVRCSLVVFADGVPMLKLAAGEGYEVSTDPDMHKIIDGHLYTTFCSDGQTIIKKDGKALFRHEGKESIRGMIVHDGDLFTLGVPYNGEGFTFRKNGQTVMERRAGYVFERLNMDCGKICFAFCQKVTTTDGLVERYYLVRDGRISLVDLRDETTKVWDIMSHQGETCSLVTSGPWETMELSKGEIKVNVGIPQGAEMVASRMFSAGDDLCVEGMYCHNGMTAGGIWVEGEEYMLFETGQSVSAVCATADDICCVLNPDQDNPAGLIFKSGRTYTMPDGYSCMGNSPSAVHDGNLYVGLTSSKGSNPLIWKDGTTQALRLNGPLCSLTFSSDESE